jgi:hypothetical protein
MCTIIADREHREGREPTTAAAVKKAIDRYRRKTLRKT